MTEWRKLAHDDDAGSSTLAGSSGKPKFDHPEREGAEALGQADYEEIEAFEQPMLDLLKAGKTPASFCCASCKYYVHDESKLKGGYCEELAAEDAPHGCCVRWQFNQSGKIREANGEAAAEK